MLEVGRVVHAGGEHDHRRVAGAGGRGRPQRLEQAGRVAVDGPHPVAGEQLGEHPGHGAAVLDHVGDARRGAEVVLQHPEHAVGAPHQVDAGDVDPHPVGGVDAHRRPVVVGRGGDELAGDEAVLQDAARPVDVGEERLQGPDPLRHARLDGRPLGRRQDAGDEVEGEGTLLARQGEGDALVAERHVPGRAAGREVGRPTGTGGPRGGRRRPAGGGRRRRTSRPTRCRPGSRRENPPSAGWSHPLVSSVFPRSNGRVTRRAEPPGFHRQDYERAELSSHSMRGASDHSRSRS